MVERNSIKPKLTFSWHYAAGWSHSVAFSLFPDYTIRTKSNKFDISGTFNKHIFVIIFVTTVWCCSGNQKRIWLLCKFSEPRYFDTEIYGQIFIFLYSFSMGHPIIFTIQDPENSFSVQHYSLLKKLSTSLFNIAICVGSKPLLGHLYKVINKYYNLMCF